MRTYVVSYLVSMLLVAGALILCGCGQEGTGPFPVPTLVPTNTSLPVLGGSPDPGCYAPPGHADACPTPVPTTVATATPTPTATPTYTPMSKHHGKRGEDPCEAGRREGR